MHKNVLFISEPRFMTIILLSYTLTGKTISFLNFEKNSLVRRIKPPWLFQILSILWVACLNIVSKNMFRHLKIFGNELVQIVFTWTFWPASWGPEQLSECLLWIPQNMLSTKTVKCNFKVTAKCLWWYHPGFKETLSSSYIFQHFYFIMTTLVTEIDNNITQLTTVVSHY